jgi:hypothetical protein
LSEQQKVEIIEKLNSHGIIDPIRSTFTPFAGLYPKFPLSFLTRNILNKEKPNLKNEIDKIKGVVLSLYDRRSIFSMRVQATVLYIGFVNDFIKVQEGLALADFPEIEKYPDTERSMEVAASIRATINVMSFEYKENNYINWSTYFWNRGLEIEPCQQMDEL